MTYLDFISGEAYSGEVDAHADFVECYPGPMQGVKLPCNVKRVFDRDLSICNRHACRS